MLRGWVSNVAIQRNLLASAFPGQPRLIAEFENLGDTVDDTADIAGQAVAATKEASAASYVTLSANDALPNEFILTPGPGIRIRNDDGKATILARVTSQGGDVQLRSPGPQVSLGLPAQGTLATLAGEEDLSDKTLVAPKASGLPIFADNTAAASLPVGSIYRTATGVLMVRF